MDVLDVMNERPNICKYLDIPLQHGSTKMLQLMRRGITREKTEQLLQSMRDRVPGIALRTTLIAGHPGETEEDFAQLMDFIEKSRFERLGIFNYSHEENTHAYAMTDDIPEEVKQERADAVMELQETISLEINQQRVGQELKVLVDRKEGTQYIGRSEYDSPEVDNEVIIHAPHVYLRTGDFVKVKITGATAFDLTAEPVTQDEI